MIKFKNISNNYNKYLLIRIIFLFRNIIKMSQSLVNSLNSFSFKVFNSLNNEADKSMCFSPFSLMIILSMVMTGTRKDTEKELKSLLSYDQFTKQEILEMNRRFLIKLSLINFLNSNIKLNAANKVYSKQGFRINNTFTKNLRKYFSSELEQLDFGQKELSAQKINDWVSAKTNKLIKNIIGPNSLTKETHMILINAIYFKGSWASQFPKSRTKKSNFTLLDGSFQQVDMMNQEQHFLVSIKPDGLKASICTMPYRSSIIKSLSASMSIILPDRDSSVTEIEQNLNLTHVFSGQGKIRKVNLSVPKFKMELEYEVINHNLI